MRNRSREGSSAGAVLPGFDSASGKAVSHNRGEWERLCKDYVFEQRDGFVKAFDANNKLQFEIFDNGPYSWFLK
jgi:hypothetical protein